MADSTQHKIGRNRPPRVQITYDVEIGNAIEKVEIPFVVGIMADLSGRGANGRNEEVALKDKSRSFVEIDRDNFTDVMAKLSPAMTWDGDDLAFRSLDDFRPDELVKRIGSLKELQEQRSALRDILTKLDSNDALHDELKTRVEQGTLDVAGKEAGQRLEQMKTLTDASAPSTPKGTAAAGKPAEKPVAGGASGGEIAGDDKKK
ncbi:hypothetical protein Dsin_033167 [Dipteronia sinensis]|uniref:Type VI secretion system contractile sheath small subunit n=1 Tax=Dipteronia sinensis TaxID=43782 RepID=A0AAD9Z5T3_9ROSI|nr:hypothetical protein Dsin_033167 [Dipteronia sinensis]